MPSQVAAHRDPARISALLQQGVAHHQAGRLAEAEDLYRSILVEDSRQPDALHLLGLAAHQRGDQAAAADLVRRALNWRADFPAALTTLGNIRIAQGRPKEAVTAYRRALASAPGEPEMLHNLAGALVAAGSPAEAITAYRQALAARPTQHASRLALARALCAAGDLAAGELELRTLLSLSPGDVVALGVLGSVQLDRGEMDAALETYLSAFRLASEDFEANTGLGVIALRRAQPATALHHFEIAHRAAPASVLAASNLGAALRALDRHAEALPLLESVVAQEPRHVMALCNLGAVYLDLGRTGDALACFDRAVTSDPRAAEAHTNRACALCDMGRYPDAVPAAQRALSLAPGMPTALSVLGRALGELGMAEQAIAACRDAIARQPSNSEAHWNLALPLLRTGQYAEGWREFEWRFEAQRRRLRPTPNGLPRWKGEPLAGRTLLVYWEQGFGDSIHFARYIPLLASQGARILLQVQTPLTRLFERLDGVAEFVDRDATGVRADFQVAMMSLPCLFGTTLATVPNTIPYLHAPAGASPLLPPSAGRRRIGLAWSGSPAQANNRFRSVPLAELAPLLALPEIDWVSLQVGATAAELATTPASSRLIDITPKLADFADTAALMQELDLIITIDTSVAHLAGALGRPVWLMLSHTCCWRYLLDRSDSPWYPTARLFRQPSRGDWASVVSTVRAALEESAP